MASKSALPNAKRTNLFTMLPNDITIPGYDNDDSTDDNGLVDVSDRHDIDEAMVRNIDYHGVLENIIVRKNGDEVEVVDGRRRIIHARVVNEQREKEGRPLLQVPVLVKRGSEADLVGMMISANEIRKDDSISVKSQKAIWLENQGKTPEEIALHFGVTETAVKSWLRFGDLHKDVQDAVEEKKLSASAALPLADLKKKEQPEALEELLASGKKPTTARAKEKAKEKKAKASGKDPANVTKKVGKRVWQAIFDACQVNEHYAAVFEGVNPIDLGYVIIGEKSPKTIKGLTALLNENE